MDFSHKGNWIDSLDIQFELPFDQPQNYIC